MEVGVKVKTLVNFQSLKPAEETLLTCCQNGEMAVIGEERPTEKTETNEIRAEFLRWLILTNEIEIDPLGIQIKGAWASGEFNLDDVECLYILGFWKCVFEEILYFRRLTIKMFYADGSLLEKGLLADGLICNRNVHLRDGFQANDKVRFVGAKIAGSLDCTNAVFTALNDNNPAFICNGTRVSEIFFLEDDCRITKGYLDLTYMNIGALSSDDEFWQQKIYKKFISMVLNMSTFIEVHRLFFLLKICLAKCQNFNRNRTANWQKCSVKWDMIEMPMR